MVNEQSNVEAGRPKSEDGSSVRLQILATEHWSLLATRSLTYSESFSRVAMFLSVLSGAVIALALLAQVDHFDETFVIAAILILSIVLFVGLVTIGRLAALNREDLLWVMGMNRLRRAYLEMHPDLEPYFLTSSYDDFRGVGLTMGLVDVARMSPLRNAAHGFTTLPATLSVIVGVVAGVLGALVVGRFGASAPTAVALAAAIFLTVVILLGFVMARGFKSFSTSIPARFPSP
jgi:hypothetical protein